MSVEELPVIQQISQRLDSLLERARILKPHTIEPPLEASSFGKDIANLTDRNQFSAVETVARKSFYTILHACTAIDQPEFVDIWNLLDIVQICADHDKCDPSLALWLVEELLDSQDIDGCRKVFDYLESRRERLITNAFSSGKQLVLLRSCNELLRRLSRAEDAVFCGRVFIFLFQSSPLGDKSSVNLRGEFHVENVTTFDDTSADNTEEVKEDRMEIDTEPTTEKTVVAKAEEVAVERANDGAVVAAAVPPQASKAVTLASDTSKGTPDKIDFAALYPRFWSLQQMFSNPTKAFVQEDLAEFRSNLELTVQSFAAISKPEETRQGDSNKKDLKRTRSREPEELASSFNPKYLTNKDLFELEMSDSTFRRHILVQALILLDFLLTLTPKAKKLTATLKAQKAMIYNYTLGEEETTWATTMRGTIVSYLQDGPEGKFYYRMVDNVLARDKNWVHWKIESCPPITKDPTPTEEYLGARNSVKRSFASKRIRARVMGALDLSFLSDTQNYNNLDKLRKPPSVPSTQTYLKEISEIDLDLEMAGKDEAPMLVQQRAVKTWNVLRISAKARLAQFGQVDEAKSLELLGKDMSAVPQEGEVLGEKDTDVGGDTAVGETGVGQEKGSTDVVMITTSKDVVMTEEDTVEKADANATVPGERV